MRNELARGNIELPVLVLWSALTLMYGIFLVWRWTIIGAPPGLRSVGGISSVASLWIYVSVTRGWYTGSRTPTRRLRRLEVILLLVLIAAILVNAVGITESVFGSKDYPLISVVATAFLIAVFQYVLRQVLSRRRRERFSPSL